MSQRLHRNEVPMEQRWDLESLYPSPSDWALDVALLEEQVRQFKEDYPGHVADATGLLTALRRMDLIRQGLIRITYYADNRLAEDQSDPTTQGLREESGRVITLVSTALSSFKPELLALPAGTVARFLADEPELLPYRLFLEEMLLEQAHQLSAEAEGVIASFSELSQAPFQIWQNAVTADLVMDPVRDEDGNMAPMSYGALSHLYQSKDRSVRKAAFDSLTTGYARHKHTLAATFAAAIKRDILLARLRRYPSSLAAALAPVRLPESVIRCLAETAEAGSIHLRRYMAFRCRELGLHQQAPYDLSVPLDKELTISLSFADGFDLVMQATGPLGPEYQALLEQARRERWIDWADNVGKRNLPYSRDCYGYHPAILVTWHGNLPDTFVLAHELGHALHTSLSQASQPFVYSHYSGLLAETASTTNELLLAHHLVQTSSDRALRRYVLTKAIDSFVVNFFYSSMMSALQLETHAMAERGEPLTYESVTAVNTFIYRRFYGDTLAVTPDGIGSQWLRAPQHYNGFYAYQYVIGITAAAALTQAILTEGEVAVQRYLGLLKAGSSAPPLAVLGAAGIDLSTREAAERAVATFGALVTELENA